MKGGVKMFCPECGKGMEADTLFCPECGAKVGADVKTASPVTQKDKKRMGLIFISIFTGFGGFLLMLIGIFGLSATYAGLSLFGVLSASPFLKGADFSEESNLGLWAGLLSYFAVLIGTLSMTGAYGLWNLVGWGRRLIIALYMLSIPINFFSLIGSGHAFERIVLMLVWIIISILIILYLSMPDIKKIFQ